MADRRIRVVVDADSEGDFSAAARSLDQVAKGADDADARLSRLSRGTAALGAEIARTSTAVHSMREEFAKTGDLKLLGDINKQQASLTRMRVMFAKFGDDVHQSFWSRVFMLGGSSIPNELIPAMAGVGEKAGTIFSLGFRGALISVAPQLGIAFAVPLMASMSGVIAGAATGGLGLAAIGVAIAAQLQNDRIKAAATQLGQELRTKILVATEGLQQPIVDAFRVLSREISPFFVEIRRGFDAIAPYVTNLAFRIGEGFAKIGPMIGDALARSGPVLGAIANGIEMLIVAVGRFFDEVSKAGEGGAMAMDMIFRAVSGLITGMGMAVRWGAELFAVFVKIGTGLTGFLSKIPGLGKLWEGPAAFMKSLSESADKGTLSTGNFASSLTGLGSAASGASGALSGTAAAAWSVKGAFDAASGGSIGLLQANLAGHQAITSFNEALQASNGSLDINTAKGQAAMQAALGLRDAAIEVGQRVFEQTHSSAAAAAAIEDYRGAMISAMVQSGMTAEAARRVTNELLGIPEDVNPKVNAETDDAMARISGVERRLDLIDGKTASTYVYNNVITRYSSIGTPSGGGTGGRAFAMAQAKGGIVEAARGLIARGGPLIKWAEPETGGEAFIPRLGISAKRAFSLLNTAASWHNMAVVPRTSGYGSSVSAAGGGAVVLRLEPGSVGSGLERELLLFLARSIRTDRATASVIKAAANS